MNKLTADLFLELIADPTKYRTYLERIESERQRLEAVVATVGKASDLDQLRKQVEKEQEEGKAALESKVKDAEMRLELKFKMAADAQKSADTTLADAQELLIKAQQKDEQAKELATSFEGRDKALRANEEFVKQRQSKLDELIEEYNEKVAKLRAVMA